MLDVKLRNLVGASRIDGPDVAAMTSWTARSSLIACSLTGR